MNNNSLPLGQTLNLGPRPQLPPNVQNASLANGMTGFYTPISAQHAQGYNGYSQVQNPTLNLPSNATIIQRQNPEGTFDVFYGTGQPAYQQGGNFCFQPHYSQMPVQMLQNYAPIQPPVDPNGSYMSRFPPVAVPSQANYPMQQPQPASQPTQTRQNREKRILSIVHPETNAPVILGSNEPSPEPAPEAKTEEPPASGNNAEDAQKRFRTAMSGLVKLDESSKEPNEKAETPQVQTAASAVVQQPLPPSSAPPSSTGDESTTVQTSVKAASAEPTIKIDLTPAQPTDNNATSERPASPTQTAAADGKDAQAQEEEDTKKLLELERQFGELHEKEIEHVNQKEYSFEFLGIIREIVKCYKKTLPPVELELLKKKGLDVHSELPQQMQNRSKYMNTSNAFNPGWNSNQQQIVGNRNKLYGGRHSDNKMRKKGSVTNRPSYGGLRQPPAPPVLDLRKAENAWKPRRRDDAALSEEEKKYETVRKEIRSILNKITPTTYDELIQQFFAIDVAQDESCQKIAIELIFDKAVEEPKFCSLYTKLCKEQVDRGTRAEGSFFHTLIGKVQSTFEGNSAFDENIKEISAKLENETDEKKKADLVERLEMLQEKEKRSILGNIKFISHLYTVGLIADLIIDFCVSTLYQMFNKTKDDIYVQYGIELLELISSFYFTEAKVKLRQAKNKDSDNVQTFIRWVSTEDCKNAVSTKIRVMIMNFEDFMKAGYTKRNADKGPKTIQQLHEDIRKEEELKKSERLAYEAKQQQQQQRNDRHHQPYMGRGSQDHKNVQNKRISAAIASNNASSLAPSRSFNLKETMKDGSSTKLGGTSSFFNKKNEESNKVAGNAGEKKAGEWSTAGGKRSGSAQNQSRKSSLERN